MNSLFQINRLMSLTAQGSIAKDALVIFHPLINGDRSLVDAVRHEGRIILVGGCGRFSKQ